MIKEEIFEKYLEALLHGDRKSSRIAIEETLKSGIPANKS